MQSVKKKWQMLKTYRRVRKLWNEYKEVAQISDVTVVGAKLNEFLDSFVLSYQDLMDEPKVKINLDKIYGDCSEILLNLMDMVERETEKSTFQENVFADLLNKALNVAELILHDEKYRLVVAETPNLINRILSLLDSMKTVENKKLVLRVISVLSDSTENKLEIGRLEGFAKIMKLLFAQDKELTREILKTLKHFLDSQNSAVIESVKEMTEETKKISSSLLVTDYLPEKMRSVMSDVTKILVSVFSKSAGNEDYDSDKEDQSAVFESASFIPSKEAISEAIEQLATKSDQGNKVVKESEIVVPKENEALTSDLNEVKVGMNKNEEEILKEFMRVQGALTTLTATLQEAALTVQLDLVETISTLIFKNQKNQSEFKKIDGYSFFSRLFDSVSDFSRKESRLFLEDCFSLLFTITLDGNKSKRVGNFDALEFLFRIVKYSKQHEVKMQALRCIQDILSVNPLNVVDVKHVGGIEKLLSLLLAADDTDITSHKQDQFVRSVTDLLNYIGVLFSNHNTNIMEAYISILSENIPRRTHARVLYSLVSLLSDSLYHHVNISDKFLSNFMRILRQWISTNVPHVEQNHLSVDQESQPQILHPTDFSEEQLLQSLEVLGLILRGDKHKYSLFVESGGLDLLSDLITLAVPKDVVEFVLWLVEELVNFDVANLKWYVRLLEESKYPFLVKEQACYTLAELVTSPTGHIDATFREVGGFLSLLQILQGASHFSKDVIYAVIYTLGACVTGSPDNKAFIESCVGFVHLSTLIKATSIPLDMTLFSAILELACNGSIRKALGLISRDKLNHSKQVIPKISNILTPRALYTHPIACTRNPLDSLSLSSLSLSLKERDNQTHSNSSSRHSSFSEDGENFDFYLSGEPTDQNLEHDTSVHEVNTGSHPNTSESIFIKGLDQTKLCRIQLRNPTAALMVIDLLPSVDSSVQGEVLNLLLKLLESNPSNKQVFCSAQGLKHLLNLGNQSDEVLQSAYFQLIASLGSYDISHSEVRLLFDLACLSLSKDDHNKHREKELQMQLLFVVGSITERKAPLNFFHLNGIDSYGQFKMAERFPKNGYTLSCWLKVDYFLNEECVLFSWQDQNGRNIFDMTFKALTNTSDGSSRFCLCVQTQHYSLPPENFIFDGYSFAECGTWHHLVFTHKQQKADLFIDGEFVQSCTLNYPSNVTKDRITAISLGYSVHGETVKRSSKIRSKGPFCGQLGAMHFLEGVWDESLSARVYTKGSLFAQPFRTQGIESKEFLVINPTCKETAVVAVPPALPVATSLPSIPPTSDSQVNTQTPSNPQSPKKERAQQEHEDTTPIVHNTHSLKEVIHEVGGIQLCFPFLDMGPAQQVAGLRILTALLQQSETNMRHFIDINGFSILYFLLSKSASELTLDIFDVLIDLACDGVTFRSKRRYIKHKECMTLILDLVLLCDASLQQQVLKSVTDLALSLPDNLVLLSSVGLPTLLNLFSGTSLSLLTTSTSVLRKMMPTLSAEDVEILFDFLVTDKDKLLEVKQDILKLVYEEMQRSPLLLEYLMKIGGFQYTFSLLESPYEEIRILSLKITGLLLHANRANNAAFARIFGFEVISLLLVPYTATHVTCTTLLELALGLYHWIGERKSTWMDLFSSGNDQPRTKKDPSVSQLVHPEAVHVLLELLKTCPNAELQMQFLLEIERILAPHNMEVLWNTAWLDWVLDYIQTVSATTDHSPKIIEQLFNISQKMVLYDITRKSSQIMKLKDMVENEQFQIQVLEGVIDYFESNPSLPAEQAADIIFNLAQLYKYVEDIEIPPQVCRRIIDSINTLACQNTSVVRAAMKSRGLFDLRDTLIIRMLRGVEGENESTLNETRAEFIYSFAFESIADQKAFRDTNNGILYLLHIFHESRADPNLQSALYDILRNVLGPIEENKKMICSILEDPDVISKFFQHAVATAEVLNSPALNAEDAQDDISVPPPMEQEISKELTFLEWYYSSDQQVTQKREETELKIQRLLAQPETKLKNLQKTVAQKQLKKLKQRKDKLAKNITAMNKAINENEDKRKQRLSRGQVNSSQRITQVVQSRSQRIALGEQNWQTFSKPTYTLYSEAILPQQL